MKKGFTLAEVLVTLGIIGIVAAMTLPGLIANHRKKVVEVRLSKFYSSINQAIKLSELDNGDKKYWEQLSNGYIVNEDGKIVSGNIAWFDKYLAKYLKTLKVETSNAIHNKLMLYFPDGSLVLISGSSWLFYPEAKDYIELTNESGNVYYDSSNSGIKYFDFFFAPVVPNSDSRYPSRYKYHLNRGVEPYLYDWHGDVRVLKSSSSYGCNTNKNHERAYCTALIMQNGWKIPKDYPLKF